MKIEVFLRHCYTSKVNLSGANRPDWWDKKKGIPKLQKYPQSRNHQLHNHL